MAASKDINAPDDEGERAARDTDFALVVGVDDYPRFRPLRGAVTDARRFHGWLCAPDGGGLRPDNARLLVSTADPPTPLQDQIDDALEHLLAAARGIGGGRRLYFHFSGHGAMSPGSSRDDVALLLAKWSRVRARLALSSEEYIGTLSALGLFDEVAVFLDCCRATAAQVVGLPPTFSASAAPGAIARAFIGYATEAGQSAFEERDDCRWQGVFTRSLLSILQRTARGIDAIGLKRGLEREVAMRGQQAHIINGLRDDSWFGTQGVLPRLEVRFAGTAGTVVLRNGMNAVIDQHVIDGAPWVLPLAPGLYKLEHEAGPPVLIDHGKEDMTRVELWPSVLRSRGAPPGAEASDAPDPRPVLLVQPDIDPDEVFAVRSDRANDPDPAEELREAPASPASPSEVRRTARLPAAAFWVTAAPATQIVIYDGAGALVASGDGMLRVALAPGLYRVHFRRFGMVRERIVDHGRFTELRDDGPPLVTPAPVTGAASSHDYYAMAASQLSTEDTCAPLGQPASSRLFVYVRRRSRDDGPRHVPSEPVTLHDINGRTLMALDVDTSHVDPALGYAAWSRRVALGTYRLRAGRSRRDLAITIPPGRAAQVFLADRGSVALDDARVSLVDLDRPFDPANPNARAIEDALLALRSPHATLPSALRELPAEAWEDDLCLGIAVAHLAWRSRDLVTLERVLDRLRRHDGIPDIAILCHVASPSPRGPAASALSAPPLFLASLILALTAPELERFAVEASGAVEQATRSKYLDSIWCTWSARAWDERWIEPTVDALRHQRPGLSMQSLSRRLCLLPRTVSRTLAGLDAAPPAAGDSLPRRIIDVLDESDAPMELDAACRVVLDALGGLSALHHQRAAHLGIEPGTVLLDGDGRASLAAPASSGPLPGTDPAGPEPSATNRIRFAPPEQLRDRSQAGPASDIWAMAATLYFMLTLELPREIYADQSELEAALDNPAVPIRERRPDLPEALAACIDRALATAPDARPRDAATFSHELAASLHAGSPAPQDGVTRATGSRDRPGAP